MSCKACETMGLVAEHSAEFCPQYAAGMHFSHSQSAAEWRSYVETSTLPRAVFEKIERSWAKPRWANLE